MKTIKLCSLLSTAALLSFGLVACKNDNPNYCEGANANNNCAEVDATVGGCTSSAECAAPTAVCDVGGTNTCVACTPAEAEACTGTTPVCGSDNACQACTTHAECSASDVCLPTGACADATTVAYVAPGGSGTTCTQAAPCNKLGAALLTDRPYVKMTGTINDQVTLTNKTVTVLADPGAVLTDTTTGILMRVEGASQVSIYDLTIQEALGGTNAGLSLQPGNTSTVRLERVMVSGHAGAGITMSGGTLTVTRSTLTQNQGGGLDMTALGVVTLTNNVVHHNGNNVTAEFGGLRLRPMAGSKVEFNTVVDNLANTDTLSIGGVSCTGATFVADGNVIFRNQGGATTEQATGSCTYGTSFKAAGISTTDNTPMFVKPNMQPYDYHLTAASPTTILNAGGACTGVDLDGDARPQGGACDLGADELVP